MLVAGHDDGTMSAPHFNTYVWVPALKGLDVAQGRENSMHGLRHWNAGVLLDPGQSIKAVSEHLVHASAFTLAACTPHADQRAAHQLGGRSRPRPRTTSHGLTTARAGVAVR